METILEVKNLSYSYYDGDKKRIVLEDCNCVLEEGCFYTIQGASGSGKTTLLSLMAGLDDVQEGSITFQGKELKVIGLEKYRRNKISIVFQQYNLIPYLTALENVLFAMKETDNDIPKNRREVAYALLEQVGIVQSKANRLISQLSGGEQQRCAIARALATNVSLIFCDEPTGNLDEETAYEIIKLFQTLCHEYHKTLVVVTHSKELAQYSDVQYLLHHGKLEKVEQK